MSPFEGTLIATSVVRGSQQGDSHGGVYLINFSNQEIIQTIDWNTGDIDFQGRGWDRGLRGVEFYNDKVVIAASDEIFVYHPDFTLIDSYRNPYLKHCHEIARFGQNLFVTSTGFNSVLAFDLEVLEFTWGLHLQQDGQRVYGTPFSPLGISGPIERNYHHINNVFCDQTGMYLSGRGGNALLKFDGKEISHVCDLPKGIHNARPFNDGVLFNHTESDVVRYQSEYKTIDLAVPKYTEDTLTHTDFDDSKLARQGFGRGLCAINDRVIAAGSSPSTITLYDLVQQQILVSVNLTMDVRNAIHGLQVWPYSV